MSRHAVDIPADIGSLILGGLFAFSLSGCVSMQFVMYWQIYPQDRWTTKLLVTATWMIDLFHSVFVAVAIWDTVVVSYGNLSHTDIIPWSVGPTVGMTAMTTFLMQSFFAYRIYRLQNRKCLVAGPTSFLAFIKLGAAIVTMAEMINLKCYSEFEQSFTFWMFTLGLSLSAFVDAIITASLCYFLRSNRSLVPSTNHLIGVLTLWTVQTGTITCLGAILTLACWLAMPQNRVFLGVHFVVGKLYPNCLLATLNARNRIRSRKYHAADQIRPISMPPDTTFGVDYRGTSPRSPQPCAARVDLFARRPVSLTRTRSIEINIQRTVESKYDGADVDILSVTAETVREEEEEESAPIVPPSCPVPELAV